MLSNIFLAYAFFSLTLIGAINILWIQLFFFNIVCGKNQIQHTRFMWTSTEQQDAIVSFSKQHGGAFINSKRLRYSNFLLIYQIAVLMYRQKCMAFLWWHFGIVLTGINAMFVLDSKHNDLVMLQNNQQITLKLLYLKINYAVHERIENTRKWITQWFSSRDFVET